MTEITIKNVISIFIVLLFFIGMIYVMDMTKNELKKQDIKNMTTCIEKYNKITEKWYNMKYKDENVIKMCNELIEINKYKGLIK